MSHGILFRLRALLLALVLVGSYVPPDFDALLYHARSSTDPLQPHVELPSGCAGHSDRCLLRTAATGPQLANRLFGGTILRLAEDTSTSIHRPTVSWTDPPRTPRHSRAPPAILG